MLEFQTLHATSVCDWPPLGDLAIFLMALRLCKRGLREARGSAYKVTLCWNCGINEWLR
jgi:hypothetical protein